jgi:dephospho-CoA kinase
MKWKVVWKSMVDRIIAVTGLPGAGKSIVSEVAREMGYHVYSMGDVVRDEADRLGIECAPTNLGLLALELRKKNGPAIVARMLVDRVKQDDAATVVVEGIRSIEEVKEFRKCFKVGILSVVCPKEVRYLRLIARGRSDDPRNIAEFNERDERELDFGISKDIDSADWHISNETDEKTLRREVNRVLLEIVSIG